MIDIQTVDGSDVPGEVIEVVSHYANLLRLDMWQIKIGVADCVGNDPGNEGLTTCNPRYWMARVEFGRRELG